MQTKDRSHELHKRAASVFLLVVAGWQVFWLVVVFWNILPRPVDWGKTSELISNLAMVAALIIGGIWTYYLFIKGRVLKPRLEPKVYGEIVTINTKKYLRASAELKNVGSSEVKFTKQALNLVPFAERAHPVVSLEDATHYKLIATDWEALLPLGVFARHAWIEPGETIRDEALLEILIDETIAYRIDFVIFAGGITWRATSIVSPKPKDQPTGNFSNGGPP
jgi:hypothetical protein